MNDCIDGRDTVGGSGTGMAFGSRERESEWLSSKIRERELERYNLSVKVANNKGKWHFPIENLDNWINPLYSVAFVLSLTAIKREPGISITKIKKILTIGPQDQPTV